MQTMSIVVPCWNEEEAIPHFVRAMEEIHPKLLERSVKPILWFVDDGSQDGTLQVIRALAKQREDIRYLSLSRNFGKEAALLAGLRESDGDYVAVMDVDLQDPPELLPSMLELLQNEDWDCVATRRTTRSQEPPIRSFFAHGFYGLMHKISGIGLVDGERDFRLMRACMAKAVAELPERNRFSKGLFHFVGFRTTYLTFENRPRAAGQTKWSFWKLFRYSLEGIISFSDAPLAVAGIAGVLFCLLAILCAAVAAGGGADPDAWTAVLLFASGVQLLCTGLLGLYLSKVHRETRRRPSYFIRERGGGESGTRFAEKNN